MTEQEYQKLIAKNLKRIAFENDKTQADISRDLKINKQTVSSWFRGERTPRMSKIDALCQYFNCKRSDIMEPIQDQYHEQQNVPMQENIEPSETAKPAEPQFSDTEIDLIEKYRFLDEHGKDMIDSVMEKEYARCKDEEENVITIDEETLRSMTFEDRLRFIGSEEVIALRPVARRRNK